MSNTQIIRLIKRARGGTLEAFSWLYGDLFASLYYLAYKLTGSEEAACKLTADLMLRLRASLDQPPGSENPLLFLAGGAYMLSKKLPKRESRPVPKDAPLALRLEALETEPRALLLLHCYGCFNPRRMAAVISTTEDEAVLRLMQAGERLGLSPQRRPDAPDDMMFPELSRSLSAEARRLSNIRRKVRTWDIISRCDAAISTSDTVLELVPPFKTAPSAVPPIKSCC